MEMSKLPVEAIETIKGSSKSYSELIKDIHLKFGIEVGKSLISYYKRSGPRIKPIRIAELQDWELDWLFGLYFADGSKFLEKRPRYLYTIKFALDLERDKDILERLIEILKNIGVKPTLSTYKGCLIVRMFSKELYSILPLKSEFYKPKDIFAFTSGLIDGDGSAKKSGAIIVQKRQRILMKYHNDFHYNRDFIFCGGCRPGYTRSLSCGF